jgi:hypothetical protein
MSIKMKKDPILVLEQFKITLGKILGLMTIQIKYFRNKLIITKFKKHKKT